jgi:hypothetical protein
MSEQIPQDPERAEDGGVEGAVDDLDVRDAEAEDVKGGGEPINERKRPS